LISIRILLLIPTTLYQAIACGLEDQKTPPGQRFNLGGYCLHLYTAGNKTRETDPTIVLDHSLGGVEGYLLVEELAKLGRVCIYDRAGYGWSDHSPHPRTSSHIVTELDVLLAQAGVEPPYILIGNSFASYNVRLYADRFPQKVMGLVLTDGLHETEMLNLPMPLRALKLFFISGFVMSVFGSAIGIIRLLKTCRAFELLKPELRNFSRPSLAAVQRSFCRPKHWLTMSREMMNLEASARQVSQAKPLKAIPLVSIKANSLFKPALWTKLIPLRTANKLRDRMHIEIAKLSTTCIQLPANKSSHFVWVDQPEVIVDAVKIVLDNTKT
jgi:pimeloyl-ACP methyl ester carboxylesterase